MATKKVVYRSRATGKRITKKQAIKLGKNMYTIEKMASSGHGPAKTRTVYRSVVTGALITKKAALKLDSSLYTIEEQPTSGNAPTQTHIVYRNTATGKLISKAEAEALARNVYTTEEIPVEPDDPSLFGLDVDLTGDWGTTPVVSADQGSDDKRGTIRITPGESPRADSAKAPGFVLNFKKRKAHKPFAMVLCWRQAGPDVPLYTNKVNATNHVATATSLTVTEYGSLISGAQIVFDYLVID